MDFLEGALLGPLWCDSDYENKYHRMATIVLSLMFWTGAVALVVIANRGRVSSPLMSPFFWLIVYIVLVLISPILSFIYYDKGLFVRFFTLGVQALKYTSGFVSLILAFVPRLILQPGADLRQALMQSLNKTADTFLEQSPLTGSSGGLLTIIVLGVILSVLVLFLSIVFMVFFPALLGWVMKKIQHVTDVVFLKLTVKQRAQYRRRHALPIFGYRPPVKQSRSHAVGSETIN